MELKILDKEAKNYLIAGLNALRVQYEGQMIRSTLRRILEVNLVNTKALLSDLRQATVVLEIATEMAKPKLKKIPRIAARTAPRRR